MRLIQKVLFLFFVKQPHRSNLLITGSLQVMNFLLERASGFPELSSFVSMNLIKPLLTVVIALASLVFFCFDYSYNAILRHFFIIWFSLCEA